jgi:hypothetical protein
MDKLSFSIYKGHARRSLTKVANPLAAILSSNALLSRLAVANITARKAGLSAGTLAAAEASNAILRAQSARDDLIHAAINTAKKTNNIQGVEDAFSTKVHDIILDKTLRTLGNESVLISPVESAKYLLGLH